jgi:hypothetical protein
LESILILWLVIVPFSIISIKWGMNVYRERFYYDKDWKASFINIWWMRISLIIFIVSVLSHSLIGSKSKWLYKISDTLAFLGFISFVLWFVYNYISGVRSRERRKIIKNNIKI